MRSDDEILDALGQQLEPTALSTLVARLLRVPQAWDSLRDSHNLERLIASGQPDKATPADLAMQCLGWSQVPDDLSLEAGLQAQAENAWPETGKAGTVPPDLHTAALLAVGLLRLGRSGGPRAVVDWVLQNPPAWLAPLACALPLIPDQAGLLRALVESQVPDGLLMAGRALLSMADPDRASETLLFAVPDFDIGLLEALADRGEIALARALSQGLNNHQAKGSDLGANSLADMMRRALSLRLQGRAPDAIRALENAWDAAADAAAEVADQMAEAAGQSGDAVTALEARRQAVHARPTPLRRAWLAKSLADAGQEQAALAALADPLASLEEQIAAGYALSRLGESAQAAAVLDDARDKVASKPHGCSVTWLTQLAQALHASGQIAGALDVYVECLAVNPTDTGTRVAYASLLTEAGDPQSSAHQSAIVLGLEPTRSGARRQLAAALQSAGEYNKARRTWEELASEDPSALIQAAACALEAGDHQAASNACHALLEGAPDSVELQILRARALAAQGLTDEATAALAETLDQAPESSAAWIALAEVLEKAGDSQAAESTLRRAAQALPDRAAVQAAWSQALRRLGRPSEAVPPMERAAALEPDKAHWALTLGELHQSLGNFEKALTQFKLAVERRPRDLNARIRFASALEQAGKLDEAARLVADVPLTIPPAAAGACGQILVRRALDQSDAEAAERGLRFLEQALELSPADRLAAFWRGRALELIGRPADALQAYRACTEAATEAENDFRLPALVGLARSALALGDVSLARATLETAREGHPQSAELLTALAQTLLADRQPESAVQAAEQASLLDPSSQPALRALRQAALETGREDLALRALQRLVSLRPGDSQAWLDLAGSALRSADSLLARTALARAFQSGRRIPGILRQAASVYLRMDSPKRAQRTLRRAVALDAQDAALVRLLAQTSELAGDGETAVQAWLTAAALEPGHAEAFVRAARALEALSRWNAACDVWQKAVELQPDNPALMAGLGNAYKGAGLVRQTLDTYAQAVALDPANADLLQAAGLACLDLQAYAEAADLLEKAAFLAPGQPAIALSLAESQLHLGRTADCAAALDQASASAALPARGLAMRALCLAEEGQVPGAIESFERACQVQTAAADEARWVAKAGLRLGRWQEAEHALRSALQAEAASTHLQLALVQTRLQSLTVGWILNQLEAHHHARQAGLLDAELLDSIAAEIPQGGEAQAAGMLEPLLHALRGDASDSDWDSLNGRVLSQLDDGLALPLAVAHLRASRPHQALDLLQALAAHRRPSPLAALLQGLTLSLLAKPEPGRASLETARLDPVLRPAADALAARLALLEQNADQALASLNAAVAAWPDESVWHNQLASLYLQSDDFAAAIPHLQQVLEADGENAEATLALARALRQNGQLPEARQVFSQAVALFPVQTPVWREAGEVALSTGDFEQAEAWFERACTLSPSDGDCLIGAARAALARGKSRQAVERAQAAARLAPADANVLCGLGEILEAQGKFAEALQAYDSAIANAQDAIPALLCRGRLLVRLGRAQEAAEGLSAALTESSSNDRAWAALAEICEATGDLPTALRSAANAVRIAPRNPGHHHTLGRLARRSGQLDRALDELHKAEQLGGGAAALLLEIGRVHEDRRERSLALDAYERAIAVEPQSAEAHFLAGVALKHMKSYARACRMLKKAVDLNPKDPEAHHQLAAVRALDLVHGGLQQATVHP